MIDTNKLLKIGKFKIITVCPKANTVWFNNAIKNENDATVLQIRWGNRNNLVMIIHISPYRLVQEIVSCFSLLQSL